MPDTFTQGLGLLTMLGMVTHLYLFLWLSTAVVGAHSWTFALAWDRYSSSRTLLIWKG